MLRRSIETTDKSGHPFFLAELHRIGDDNEITDQRQFAAAALAIVRNGSDHGCAEFRNPVPYF